MDTKKRYCQCCDDDCHGRSPYPGNECREIATVAELADMGLMRKNGAITPEGKNAIQSKY